MYFECRFCCRRIVAESMVIGVMPARMIEGRSVSQSINQPIKEENEGQVGWGTVCVEFVTELTRKIYMSNWMNSFANLPSE